LRIASFKTKLDLTEF